MSSKYIVAFDANHEPACANTAQRFGGIPSDLWAYEIGSYQVLAKWLKDHEGHFFAAYPRHHLCIVTTPSITGGCKCKSTGLLSDAAGSNP